MLLSPGPDYFARRARRRPVQSARPPARWDRQLDRDERNERASGKKKKKEDEVRSDFYGGKAGRLPRGE